MINGNDPQEVVGDICGSILSLLSSRRCEGASEAASGSFFSSDSLVMAHPADSSGLQPLPKHIVSKLTQLAGGSSLLTGGLLVEEAGGYSMFSGASPLAHFQQCLDFRDEDHWQNDDDGDCDEDEM